MKHLRPLALHRARSRIRRALQEGGGRVSSSGPPRGRPGPAHACAGRGDDIHRLSLGAVIPPVRRLPLGCLHRCAGRDGRRRRPRGGGLRREAHPELVEPAHHHAHGGHHGAGGGRGKAGARLARHHHPRLVQHQLVAQQRAWAGCALACARWAGRGGTHSRCGRPSSPPVPTSRTRARTGRGRRGGSTSRFQLQRRARVRPIATDTTPAAQTAKGKAIQRRRCPHPSRCGRCCRAPISTFASSFVWPHTSTYSLGQPRIDVHE